MSKTLVIDPGHGGIDPGAVGSGLLEKELNLEIAKMIANRLQQYDVKIHLTREDDIYLSLLERAGIANRLNADYFVSVHINAGGGTGFESYVHTTENPQTTELRRVVHNSVMDFLSTKGIRDRGLKSANFAVLRETNMPAVLLENLFIDNPSDAVYLKDAEFKTELAHAAAAGIAKALNLQKNEQGSSVAWNPSAEVAQLKNSGLIANDHPPNNYVTWGEFAAVMNRLIKRLEKTD